MAKIPMGRALLDPTRILEEAGIRQDMQVADMGVGAVGQFLFSAAEMVGDKGHVFGVDILKSVLEANRNTAKQAGIDNVELIWGDIERLGGTSLPDNSIDLVILVNVIQVAKRGKALAECMRILHTEGTLLIVDWKPSGTALGPSPEKRLSKQEAAQLATAAGFAPIKDFEAGPHHYGLVFTKPRA